MTAISSEACSVVIANAGSGKTWTLANRIVRWCIDELRAGRPPEPARILAVTFTRKAAGEILARILAHAAQGASSGASGEKARADFASVVGNATADEYLSVLEALCGELHRLQVGTIDGFFHRVASALPDAVGLPPEWTVGDERDIDEIRAEVAATILADPAAEELLDLLEDGEPKPSVTTAITKLLGGSGQSPLDMYRATSAKGQVGIDRAWRWVERLLAAEKFGENALGAEQRADLAARFAALELPKTKKGAPNASWTKQHAALLAILTEGELRDLADLPYFAALFDGHSYSKQPVPVEFHELAVLLAAHLRAELLRDLASRLKGALRVLPQASAALAVAQAEKGLYSFSDIGRGVARAAQRPGSPVADANALRTALGCDIRDLAIDEAQDTSVEQFLAMRPLLEEVLGATRSGRFLLVGDPKQSIYGWRGGTPGLIAYIEESYASRLSPGVALTRSFRSSPLVMDFVNRVFGKLSDDLPPLVESAQLVDLVKVAPWLKSEDLALESTESAFKRAVARWPFAHHESAKSTLAGRIDAYAYACAKTTTTDDGTAESETAEVDTSEVATVGGAEQACAEDGAPNDELDACACAAEIAARVHREFPEHSLGILVRTNKEGNEIIAQLKSRSVAASDEGRATLLDSPAVAGIVAMLRLIDDPSDRVSHFMVSRGPMALATKLAPIESHNTSAEAGAAARAFAVRIPRGRVLGLACSAVAPGGIALADVSPHAEEPLARHRALTSFVVAPAPRRIAGNCALIGAIGHNNFYHWMLDVLPRIGLVRAAGFGAIDHWIVAESKLAVTRELLAHCGIERDRLVAVGRGGHVECEQLVVTSAPGKICQPTPRSVEFLRTIFARAPGNGGGGRRIYVARRGRRKVDGEAALAPVLKRFGIESVAMEDLSIDAQISAFRGASLIVGAHGAALANIVHADHGAALVELMPPGYLNHTYFLLAGACALRYLPIVGHPLAAEGSKRVTDRDFRVEATQLDRALSAVELCA